MSLHFSSSMLDERVVPGNRSDSGYSAQYEREDRRVWRLSLKSAGSGVTQMGGVHRTPTRRCSIDPPRSAPTQISFG
jgi:hypothetical protein